MNNGSTPQGQAIVRKVTRPPSGDGAVKQVKLFIATPAYGGQLTLEYVMGFRALCENLSLQNVPYCIGLVGNESLITRARNKMVASFLETDCTHLLFIDADVGFTVEDVKSLFMAGVDVVCGAYPMKRYGWQSIIEAANRGETPEQVRLAGARYAANLSQAAQNGVPIEGIEKNGYKYFKILDAATGFLLVTRKCIESFIAHYGKTIEYTTDYEPIGVTHHRVFDVCEDPASPRQRALAILRAEAEAFTDGEEERLVTAARVYQAAMTQPAGRYLSEDYGFSRMWQMDGRRYLAEPRGQVDAHWNAYVAWGY